MTQSGHSALLTNVVADDAAGEAGFRLPRLPRRRIDTAVAPVPLPGRFFFFSATAGKKIPCDDHHCARGCVGLSFHPKSTRIWDGNHVAADSANHDRRRDGVDRERVGVRGGRIGRRVNPPVHLTGGRPLGAVAARNPPRRPSGDGGAARCIGSCPVTDGAPSPGWSVMWISVRIIVTSAGIRVTGWNFRGRANAASPSSPGWSRSGTASRQPR